MGHIPLSRPLQLSIGFSRLLLLLLNGVRHVLWWALGLLALMFIPVLIFESWNGLKDISPAEWLFLLLWLSLARRHIRRCKVFQYGFWDGLDRFLKAQGLLAVAFLVTTGLCFTVAVVAIEPPRVSEAAMELQTFLFHSKPSEFALLGLLLLTIYLAAPVQARQPQLDESLKLGAHERGADVMTVEKAGLRVGKSLLPLLLLLGLWLPAPSAHASPAYHELITNCRELLALHGRKATPLAALTTSVSEAMKAGYCLGVIDQYRSQHRGYCRNDNYEFAQHLVRAASTPGAHWPGNLLRRACNG